MKFMKKFMISSFLAITLLVSIAPAKTSFAASSCSNSCSKLIWVKKAYPDAYDYKFINGDRPHVRVYPTKGSLDHFIVYCEYIEDGHCMVCD